jgi:hypothetical protein
LCQASKKVNQSGRTLVAMSDCFIRLNEDENPCQSTSQNHAAQKLRGWRHSQQKVGVGRSEERQQLGSNGGALRGFTGFPWFISCTCAHVITHVPDMEEACWLLGKIPVWVWGQVWQDPKLSRALRARFPVLHTWVPGP